MPFIFDAPTNTLGVTNMAATKKAKQTGIYESTVGEATRHWVKAGTDIPAEYRFVEEVEHLQTREEIAPDDSVPDDEPETKVQKAPKA